MATEAVQRQEYTPEEIDRALIVLAHCGGNARRASRELDIPDRTLRSWRSDKHQERYLELCEREGPKLEQLAAQQARELLLRAADTEHSILDRLNEETEEPLSSKELSELAGALQRVTTSKGINTTKLLELTGRPTTIVAHEDPRDAGIRLAKRYGITIEATAEDITTPTNPPSMPARAEANARGTQSQEAED